MLKNKFVTISVYEDKEFLFETTLDQDNFDFVGIDKILHKQVITLCNLKKDKILQKAEGQLVVFRMDNSFEVIGVDIKI